MQKTPSYLKGLAETRARADAEALRLRKVIAEVAERLAQAEKTRDSCDCLIRKFDARLDPSLIEPIQAWKGRYGARGALQNSIERQVREAYPGELTTSEIGWGLQIEFNIDFAHPNEKYHWQHNTVGRALNIFVKRGSIARLPNLPDEPTSAVGRWRWIPDDGLSLDHLREQTVAAGRAVQQCDDDHG